VTAEPQLKDFSPEALRDRLRAEGHPAYRAEQISAWVYARGVEDPQHMTDLDPKLRRSLAEDYEMRALEVDALERSQDGTLKGRLRARDGAVLEAVLIPEEERTTLCVSTQVGCPLACSFCATGTLGLDRNLTTAEIVDQVCRMRELLPDDRRISNVVFMGMGEPLLNLPNVLEAIRTLLHPKAFALAPRRVTVSTAGVVPRIGALLEAAPVNLAVSLHATTDAVRDELVPLNRRFPLAELLATLRALPRLSRRHPIFFEYTLMEGVNDSLDDARRLVALLKDIPAKLNVIPMNPHAGAPYRPPPDGRPRGSDIDAACGQLAGRRDASQARPQTPNSGANAPG
jgi:23S rRNA (adenine2503-C2)-methyltransferase